jgi:hypothetical protein
MLSVFSTVNRTGVRGGTVELAQERVGEQGEAHRDHQRADAVLRRSECVS